MSATLTAESKPLVRTVPQRTRADYEDFLYNEAALLDEWRLEEWLALFIEGSIYEVPTTGRPEDVQSSDELFYISDNWFRLQHRVSRLLKKGAHSEWPRTIGLRTISNVRILGEEPDGVRVGCAFTTYRSRDDRTDTYFGHHRYLFTEVDGGLRIAEKRSLLAMSSLRPHGRVSIIV